MLHCRADAVAKLECSGYSFMLRFTSRINPANFAVMAKRKGQR